MSERGLSAGASASNNCPKYMYGTRVYKLRQPLDTLCPKVEGQECAQLFLFALTSLAFGARETAMKRDLGDLQAPGNSAKLENRQDLS